jgi:hypothetical protein
VPHPIPITSIGSGNRADTQLIKASLKLNWRLELCEIYLKANIEQYGADTKTDMKTIE